MYQDLIKRFFEKEIQFECHVTLDDRTYTLGYSEDKGIYGDYPDEYETAEDFLNNSDEVIDFKLF